MAHGQKDASRAIRREVLVDDRHLLVGAILVVVAVIGGSGVAFG